LEQLYGQAEAEPTLSGSHESEDTEDIMAEEDIEAGPSIPLLSREGKD
jgi:hypothetical protein